MVTAISLVNARNTILRGNWISGFDTAIKARNSSFILQNNLITDNRIGLDFADSRAIISESLVIRNQIDLLARRTDFRTIDSLVFNIVVRNLHNIPHDNIHVDAHRIAAQASDVLHADNNHTKEERFKTLLGTLYKYGQYIQFCINMLRMIFGSVGFPV